MSLVNHSLKMNANIAFQKFHASSINVYYDGNDARDFYLAFRQFGSLATKINVSALYGFNDGDIFHDDGNKILRTIGYFCGASLNELSLRGVKINLSTETCSSRSFSKIKNRLAGLSKLTLTNVFVRRKFLKFATELNELTIVNCRMEELPEVATLPQLRTISVNACSHWPFIMGNNFDQFLRANPSIETVVYCLNIGGSVHLKSICDLPKLRSLTIVLVHYNQQLESLLVNVGKSLKKLDIRGHKKYSLIKNMIPSGCEFTFENYC